MTLSVTRKWTKMHTPPLQFKSSHPPVQSCLSYETHPAYPATVSHVPFLLQGNNFSIFILISNHIFCPMTSFQSSIVDPYFSFYVCLQCFGLWFLFINITLFLMRILQWINSPINKHLQCVRSCPMQEIPVNDTNGIA